MNIFCDLAAKPMAGLETEAPVDLQTAVESSLFADTLIPLVEAKIERGLLTDDSALPVAKEEDAVTQTTDQIAFNPGLIATPAIASDTAAFELQLVPDIKMPDWLVSSNASVSGVKPQSDASSVTADILVNARESSMPQAATLQQFAVESAEADQQFISLAMSEVSEQPIQQTPSDELIVRKAALETDAISRVPQESAAAANDVASNPARQTAVEDLPVQATMNVRAAASDESVAPQVEQVAVPTVDASDEAQSVISRPEQPIQVSTVTTNDAASNPVRRASVEDLPVQVAMNVRAAASDESIAPTVERVAVPTVDAANEAQPVNSRPEQPLPVATVAAGFQAAAQLQSAPVSPVSLASSAELHVRVIDQVVRQVRLQHIDGGSNLIVKLNPPDLGSLQLSVKSDPGGMSTHIEASNRRVQGLLEAHLPLLIDSLAKVGVRMDSVSVSVGAQFNAFTQDPRHNDPHSRGFRPRQSDSYIRDAAINPAVAETAMHRAWTMSKQSAHSWLA